MPRNASGTYTLPSGNPVVSGTLIDATWANNTLSDLGNEVTDSLSRSGEGAMLAPLRITDGVQATPSLAFSNEPSSGLYRAGSNEWWAVAAGVQNLRFTNTGLTTRAAAGAVGTPSLAAFNDTDTGIYFPGANELAIATGGVGALWVNSSQNVGVGTSSPAYKFHVERPSYGITGYFYANDGTRNPRLVVYGSSSGTTIQHTFSTGADSLIFAVGGSIGTGTEVARFVDGGNFGIGTASPAAKLESAGTSNGATLELLRLNNIGSGANTQAQINFIAASTSYGTITGGFGSAAPQMTFNLPNATAGNFVWQITSTEQMRLTSTGLGIGTTTNALTYALTLYATGATSRYMAVGNSNTGLNGTLFGIDDSGNTAINNTQNLAMLFLTNNTERGRFTAGGYFKASNAGTYDNATGSYHEIRQTTNNPTVLISNTVASFTGANIQSGVYGTVAGTGFSHIGCLNSAAATVFQVRGDGNAYNTNGTYGTISDERLKQDIVDADSQWDDIKAVRFRKYRMKADVEVNPDAPAMFGLVAQELEQTSPGLVDELVDRDAEGNDLGTKTKSVKTSILLMKAAKALQEAMARIESLEADMAALKGAK